jgi:hypothetical protein
MTMTSPPSLSFHLTSCKCQDCYSCCCPDLTYSAHLKAEYARYKEMEKNGQLLRAKAIAFAATPSLLWFSEVY